jgi:hypothetical protein
MGLSVKEELDTKYLAEYAHISSLNHLSIAEQTLNMTVGFYKDVDARFDGAACAKNKSITVKLTKEELSSLLKLTYQFLKRSGHLPGEVIDPDTREKPKAGNSMAYSPTL